MIRRALITAVAAAAALTVAPAKAGASHTVFEQVSRGAIGGNAALPTQFVGSSADGTRVILRTEEQLAASDTDSMFDLYERAGGVTTELSIGPSGGNSDFAVPTLGGMSADGRHVFFEIAENLVPADTDECDTADPEANPCTDVYESFGGTTTLISTGSSGGGPYGARFAGASEDGARVWFTTDESLLASDTDSQGDVYQRSGSTTTLVSTGPSGGNGSVEARYRGASADGARVFFSTSEQLTPEDTDSSTDIYERADGATMLVSTGPASGTPGAGAVFESASKDGSRVFFSTVEQLVPGDTDSSADIYERAGGVTTLVSTGPAGGNGSFDATFKVASDGGTRVIFESAEQLVSADTDSAQDVYQRAGGTTARLSMGASGGNGSSDALFQGASSDGSQVVFATTESLVASDTDSMADLYQRASGTTSLISTGPAGGNGPFDAYYSGMSTDGARVFFETLEPLASDSDALPDVYERAGGTTTRVSSGAGGADGDFIAVFLGASSDGSRVFFNSAEVLAGTDTDTASDVYVARIADSYVRAKGASPLSVSLVIAYRECMSPNRVHGPPALGGAASNPSCAPPVQASDQLTVGTFDANQRPVQSTGRVVFTVLTGNPSTPADEADVGLHFDMNDVRRAAGLDDYAGELTVSADVRITDRQNGSFPVDAATVVELPLSFVANCASTSDTGIGAVCALDTTVDAVVPGAIKEGVRSSWELGAVEVYDGGPDGTAGTSGDTLFATQGVFIP